METRFTTARAALFTGCVILVVSARAHADIVYPNDTIPTIPRHGFPATALSGTLGNGFGYRLPLGDTTNLRLEEYFLSARKNVSEDFYKYRFNTRQNSRSLIFDWRPFGGAFHANVGIFVNDYAAYGTGEAAGRFGLSDFTVPTISFAEVTQQDVDQLVAEIRRFDAATADELSDFFSGRDVQQLNDDAAAIVQAAIANSGTLDISNAINARARVRWNRFAPYLGFRWTNLWENRNGFSYSVDIGAMYIGRPDVDLSISGPLVNAMEPYSGTTLQHYVRQQEKQAENKLARNRVIPVVSLGAGYRF